MEPISERKRGERQLWRKRKGTLKWNFLGRRFRESGQTDEATRN